MKNPRTTLTELDKVAAYIAVKRCEQVKLRHDYNAAPASHIMAKVTRNCELIEMAEKFLAIENVRAFLKKQTT